MIKRIDQLTGAVEVGRSYLVPTVRGIWYGCLRDWPVIGVKHNDRHCLQFENDHYHLDARFLRHTNDDYDFWRGVIGSPLQTSSKINPDGLPAPIWRRRKCKRLVNPVQDDIYDRLIGNAWGQQRWKCHFDEWTGKQAKHDGRGWLCPHRAVPLVDHAPVDGVIMCPLHLLRIDAATGVVLPPLQVAGSEAA